MAKPQDPIKDYDAEFLRCRTVDHHRWELMTAATKEEGDYLAIEWTYICDRCLTRRRTTVDKDGVIIASRYSYDCAYRLSEQTVGHKVSVKELRAELVRRTTVGLVRRTTIRKAAKKKGQAA